MSALLTRNPALCQFAFADGRRCRMTRHKDHGYLCLFHARDEQQLLESQRLGAELSATLTGHFLNAADINHVLGKLFTALAQNRISQRNAHTLAYIGQLMLQSIPNVKRETRIDYNFQSWQNMLRSAVTLSDPEPESDSGSDTETNSLSELETNDEPKDHKS